METMSRPQHRTSLFFIHQNASRPRFSKEKRIAQTARAREAALKARKRRKAAAKLQAKDQQKLGYRLSSLHLSPQQMEPCQGDQSGSSKNNTKSPTVFGSHPNNTEAALPISKEHCQPEHTSTNASPSHLQRTDTLVVEYIRPRIGMSTSSMTIKPNL